MGQDEQRRKYFLNSLSRAWFGLPQIRCFGRSAFGQIGNLATLNRSGYIYHICGRVILAEYSTRGGGNRACILGQLFLPSFFIPFVSRL
jgi:hypothetical protein